MMVSTRQRDAVTSMASKSLNVQVEVPMASHTTYKVGGPAALFIEVDGPDILPALLRRLSEQDIDWLILGNGSNVLFADAGFDGAVLQLGDGFATGHVERDALGAGSHRLEAGAAMSITRLLRITKEQELAGVEYLGGVPGTVGGAIYMNAGTVMGEVSDTLEAAAVARAGQPIRWIPAGELGLAYRHSDLPEGSVVTAARFRCGDADPAMRKRLAGVLSYRKATQPLTMPSCGSVFANPPGDHAGRLIEAVGLKGHRIGGAQVSEMHANWIVNTGTATAEDIRGLIGLCVARVQETHGVTLRHEVKLLGDWGEA